MNVHQNIVIHNLRVGSLSNSSILQIGSAGMIKGLSNNFNTGGFTGPAPEAKTPGDPGFSSSTEEGGEPGAMSPLVPLPALR
jgi:spore germination protein PB